MAKKTAADAPAADAAAPTSARKAPGPVPDTPIPMCWVTDPDTPDPYLVNVTDVDKGKHTPCTPFEED